jgi:hypothetical protein
MKLSKEAMSSILAQLQVFPAFINILSSFNLQTRESTTTITGSGAFYGITNNDDSGITNSLYFSTGNVVDISLVYQTAYLFKYVEYNGRIGDQWSIRQMAFYQRFDTHHNTSQSLLIQTSDQVQKRIYQLAGEGNMTDFLNHWTSFHEIHLGTLSHNWGAYIEWIDTQLSKVVGICLTRGLWNYHQS